MVRFQVSVEVVVAPTTSSTVLAQEIIEYVVRPEHLEKHLMLKRIQEEGHTTDPGPPIVPRYHFSAYVTYKHGFLNRKMKVNMSYVQDPVSPEVTFTLHSAQTKYFSKAIRVTEIERGNTLVLLVTCDVVVEYRLHILASFSGIAQKMEANHLALLKAMKADMEAKQTKKHVQIAAAPLTPSRPATVPRPLTPTRRD